MKKCIPILMIVLTIAFSSCKKGPGEGGTSTITGKVHVTDYNSSFTTINGQYPAADVDVYIIYGDDATYGDKLKSGPDGVFEFKYLRPGGYKIYIYSKDKTAIQAGNSNAPDIAVYKGVEITKKKQTVDAGTIEIFN